MAATMRRSSLPGQLQINVCLQSVPFESPKSQRFNRFLQPGCVKFSVGMCEIDGPEGSGSEKIKARDEEIKRLFIEGMSKTQIGKRFGITGERVGQIFIKYRGHLQ